MTKTEFLNLGTQPIANRLITDASKPEYKFELAVQFDDETDLVSLVNLVPKEELFNGYVAGARLGFQYNRRLSLRVLSQYNDFSKTWNIDPLITYQISPFSLFYIGTTCYMQEVDGL